MTEHPIILFDGDCNLCTATVQFIIQRDPEARFRFAALKSPVGKRLLADYDLQDLKTETMVLIARGRAYLRSDAALEISRELSGAWPALTLLHFVPRSLRDGGYRLLAVNRRYLFGRSRSCLLPSPELDERFIDNASKKEES